MAILEEVGRGPSEAEVLAALEKLRGYRRGPGGALYTAELEWPAAQIAAGKRPLSPDDLLDWDAPLSQQPKSLLDAIESRPDLKKKLDFQRDFLKKEPTGRAAYTALAGGPQLPKRVETSALLRDMGIPGLRYLDGDSRFAGAGTRNYVIFDDALARILGRE